MTEINTTLDSIFHPKSMAFVGVTTSNPTHWTRTFWNSAIEFKFKGPIYAVNPNGGELDGHKVYKAIDEIPGTIDYVVCTVPAYKASEIVRKSASKGVKAIHFCTAGFAETGEQEMTGLQEDLIRTAHETGIRIIGPNCMGIYCPESRISFDTALARESGSIGLISQSGGNAIYTAVEANWRGVRFSKVISYGNACDLNECDFLEYMIDDPKTSVIALYLEGVRDGRRFLKLIKKASEKKTVILLKGGNGEAGSRATISHTASLSGSEDVWNALCRQFNIIKVINVEELVDVLTTLTFAPKLSGDNMLLIGPGGGASVLLTDEFERRGFKLPPVTTDIRKKLLTFTQLAGNILSNPVDYSQSMMGSGYTGKALKVLTDWKEIDFCVSFFRPSQMTEAFLEIMIKMDDVIKDYEASTKPVAFIVECSMRPDKQDAIYRVMQRIIDSRRPLYYSFPAASEALRLVVNYNHKRTDRLK
jgi:acyl-CoA synthetase (NDP forming)